MYSYLAFALGIKSDLALPEFIESQNKVDVAIRLDNSIEPSSVVTQSYLNLNQNETILSLNSIGTFYIRNGCEILIAPLPSADIRRIRQFIVGTAMAILLYQRGYLVLHASTVTFNNQAISFLGFAGTGKSSIAAALYSLGYGVLADDISIVEMNDDFPVIIPGVPQIKLTLESAKAVGLDVNDGILLDNIDDKYGYRIHKGFTDIPLSLKRIYLLQEDQCTGIELISQQTAVIKFISCSVPTLWTQLNDVNHFMQCVDLAKQVPTFLLKRNSLSQSLQDFARLVDEHIQRGNK